MSAVKTRYVGRRRWDALCRLVRLDDSGFSEISLASERGYRRFPFSKRRRTLLERRQRNCVHAHVDGYRTSWEYDEWDANCRDCGASV